MLKEIPFQKVPSFSVVLDSIRAICPGVIIETTLLDDDPDTYIFRLHRYADMPLSFELLDDLRGSNSGRRLLQLKANIQDAMNRLK